LALVEELQNKGVEEEEAVARAAVEVEQQQE